MGNQVSDVSVAYCERDGNTFNLFGEPLNVLSNFPQLILGLMYCYKLRQSSRQVLGGSLYTLVSIGSMIWHATGFLWTLYLDLFFPGLFILWFSYHWGYRVLGISSKWKRFVFPFLGLVLSHFISYWYQAPYIDSHWSWYSVMIVLAIWHRLISYWRPWSILIAVVWYGIALVFYALDSVICRDEQPGYQPGWHWLWHLFSCGGGWCLLHSLPPNDKVPSCQTKKNKMSQNVIDHDNIEMVLTKC